MSRSGVLSPTQHGINSTIFSPQGHDSALLSSGPREGGGKKEREPTEESTKTEEWID